jgi:hypothetical protein
VPFRTGVWGWCEETDRTKDGDEGRDEMGIGRGDLVVFQFLSEWARQIPSLQSNLFLSAAARCGAVPRLAVNEPED